MFLTSPEPTALSNAIDVALIKLIDREPDSAEYAAIVDQVEKLHKMQKTDRPAPVSQDTLINAATNIFAIMLIIRHEEFNNITTKALGFVPKLR